MKKAARRFPAWVRLLRSEIETTLRTEKQRARLHSRALCFSDCFQVVPMSRYRNVTICARVQVESGLKWVGSVPLVMFFSTAHSTAL